MSHDEPTPIRFPKSSGKSPSLVVALLVLPFLGCPNRSPSGKGTVADSIDQEKLNQAANIASKDVASGRNRSETENETASEPSAKRSDKQPASETVSKTAATIGDSATAGSVEADSYGESENFAPRVQNKIPSGSWTNQRLIAATTRGPAVIDLKIQIGDSDLESAGISAVEPITRSLIEKLDQPPTWSRLVALPLVQSGWLGNLTADSSATNQLISMYDTSKDDLVQPEELNIFLTRGLKKNAAIQVSDAGTESIEDGTDAQLGPLDSNQDNVISSEELERGAEQLWKLDFNGDLKLTVDELRPSTRSSTMMAGRRSNSMLRASSVVFEPVVGATQDEKTLYKQRQRKAVELMENYSFLGQIEQELWPNWSKQQWSMLDSDGDSNLSRAEVVGIFVKPIAAKVAVRLPALEDDSETLRWFAEFDQQWSWRSSANSARIFDRSLCLQIEVEGTFNKRIKSLLKAQLDRAFSDAQTKQSLLQQLQLKENALELADANADKKLQDEEFLAVWSWITARQATRLQARWMLSARPWFQLLDKDGNQSLSEQEIRQVRSTLSVFDENGDGEVTTVELPMVAKLRLTRTDSRLNIPPEMSVLAESQTSGDDWFSAMDSNGDGSISRVEFLGSEQDFQGVDKDSDGFISKSEVY